MKSTLIIAMLMAVASCQWGREKSAGSEAEESPTETRVMKAMLRGGVHTTNWATFYSE